MSMMAVTVGVGEKWRELAECSAERMRECTGLPTAVLGEEHYRRGEFRNPMFLRFTIFDEFDVENVLYFDADVAALRPWDPREFADRPELVCCREDDWDPQIKDEQRRYYIPRGEYFSNGWFIANRTHHRRLIRLALRIMWSVHSPLTDQTCMNVARRELKIPQQFVHRRYHWIHFDEPMGRCVPILNGHMAQYDRASRSGLWSESKQAALDYPAAEGEPAAAQPSWDQQLHDELAGRTWLYERVGYDQRPIELRPDGTIGAGGAAMEAYWIAFRDADGIPLLRIGRRCEITCTLKKTALDRWEGRWERYERMIIVLSDVSSTRAPLLRYSSSNRLCETMRAGKS